MNNYLSHRNHRLLVFKYRSIQRAENTDLPQSLQLTVDAPHSSTQEINSGVEQAVPTQIQFSQKRTIGAEK